MEEIDGAIAFLQELGRNDLSSLLKYSTYEFVEIDIWDGVTAPGVVIYSPPVFREALSGLSDPEKRRIGEATAAAANLARKGFDHVSFETSEGTKLDPPEQLLPEVINQRSLMIAVARGEKRIDNENDYYRARRRRITDGLRALGIDDPNPHGDLWDWYQKWKADFPSYADRMHYVNTMYEQVVDRLIEMPLPAVPLREPTGWDRVDRTLDNAQDRLSLAKHEEDFQGVGLLCREVIISLGQAVFDPEIHESPDGVVPSATDGNRMIGAFITTVAAGGSNEDLRRHARAALQLAVSLQHKRTADFRSAALCLEASSSVVNIAAILSGRRDPE